MAGKMECTLTGPYAHSGLDEEDPAKVTEVIQAVRDAVGPDFTIMVDTQYAVSPCNSAVAVVRVSTAEPPPTSPPTCRHTALWDPCTRAAATRRHLTPPSTHPTLRSCRPTDRQCSVTELMSHAQQLWTLFVDMVAQVLTHLSWPGCTLTACTHSSTAWERWCRWWRIGRPGT